METNTQKNQPKRNLQTAQAIIYNYLLAIVKQWPAEYVLQEFKHLYIDLAGSTNTDALNALYEIAFENNEVEFRYTIKRSCYILINNWDATRKHKPIQELIQLFSDYELREENIYTHLNRLKVWLLNFIKSKEFEEIKLFFNREDESKNWTQRYTSFLLVPQYIDLNNPIEQREAARSLSQRLKDKFKFDLAMYTAHSQSAIPQGKESKFKNPTELGDEVLRLIKAIVFKRGPFNHTNLAHIFIQQTYDVTYEDFKKSLLSYLIFLVFHREFAHILNDNLKEKLENTYPEHDEEILNPALSLRTCNRIIEYLTTEDNCNPSPLFILLLAQGNPINLVIVILKIILISPNSRSHLEACIAAIIQYYEKSPQEDCQWFIIFLEIFKITFTIYTENVEYSLVRIKENNLNRHNQSQCNLDSYRIFSQFKEEIKLESNLDKQIKDIYVNRKIETQD